MEKRFREWVSRCHATLDKSVRFEAPVDSRAQAALRTTMGECTTAFDRVTDGQRAVSKGDVVRIRAKPVLVGRVAYFTVPQAVREEGAYANGRVHVEPLPEEVHGVGAPLRHFSLRRIEAVMEEKEVAEHAAREAARLPGALRVEPMRFATGQALEFAAGDAVPETSVVVMSAGGQRLVRSFYDGEKQTVVVTQRLWRLPAEGAPLPSEAVQEEAGPAEEGPAAKRAKRGRKGKKQDENADPDGGRDAGAAGKAAAAPAAELILSVDNKTPNKETFQFSRLCDGLREAGHYALEYFVTPPVPGQPPLRHVVPLTVGAGEPASLSVSGEGCAAAALKVLALGEPLPPLKIMLSDAHGNTVPLAPGAATGIRVFASLATPGDEPLARCKELSVTSQQELGDECIIVSDLRVVGSKKATAAGAGLSMLLHGVPPTDASARGGQRTASQVALLVAELQLCFLLQGGAPGLEASTLPLQLRAGAPKSLRLVPGGAWGEGDAVVSVESGGELPELAVQVLDAWGNPTAPSADLPFCVEVESEVLSPSVRECSVDAMGVTHVRDLVTSSATKGAEWSALSLRPRCAPATPAAEAAAATAQPVQELE
jgi:hypothetical protein